MKWRWSRWPWNRCKAVKEPNSTGYWGRCDLVRKHEGDHALERGFDILTWSTNFRLVLAFDCDCSVHDINTPGAAHADDCPRYE